MTEFTKAINEIFKDYNFLEVCYINAEPYDCICTSVEDGVYYGDTGLVDETSFQLSLKLPLPRMPKKGDLVKFREIDYKVSSTEIDSANASISLRLQALSKG